jgi:hypothetical protein
MFDLNTNLVCINDIFSPAVCQIYPQLPRKNFIYTVRDIIPASNYGHGETCAVLLLECVNPKRKNGVENGFACHRFRELDEEEQRIFEAAKNKASRDLALSN